MESKPILLSNRVIHQLVSHSVSDQLAMSARDYMTLRMVFRQCGGLWSNLIDGDKKHLDLLKNIVKVWGAMPEQAANAKRVI